MQLCNVEFLYDRPTRKGNSDLVRMGMQENRGEFFQISPLSLCVRITDTPLLLLFFNSFLILLKLDCFLCTLF